MSDFRLTATTPLAGVSIDRPGILIREATDIGLVSLAIPLGSEADFAAKLASAYGTEPPASGRSTIADDQTRFLGLQRDQFFALFPYPGDTADRVVAERLGPVAYITDQSDSWAALELSGSSCLAVLERFCPLDLHDDAFPVGAVTRTVMEHLAVIILRTDVDAFLLLSPRSSAGSFLAVVEDAANAIA